MEQPSPVKSPRWSSTTKLVVALTFVAIVAALLVRFQSILGPLLLVFIFSYVLHPIASLINHKLHLSWRFSVVLLYFFILIIFLGLLTLGGVGLVNQIQSLITLLQTSLDQLPTYVNNVAGWAAKFGVDLSHVDLSSVSNQLLSFGQSLLSQMGTIISTVAGSAANFIGWTLFVLLVSFFVLVESGGLRGGILKVEIPGYSGDLRRLEDELGNIWNAFLRGQLIIFGEAVAVYFVVLSVLGVRYAIGLALLAGFARFVPYAGPAINWAALALVTFFQPFKLFGMEPLTYTIVVIVIALVIDQSFDNFVSPRIMADALKVHPAAVMVAAIISANVLGLLGVIIAAPMLATLKLFGQYMLRKMFDLDPWPEPQPKPAPPPQFNLLNRLQMWWSTLRKKRN